MITIVIHLLHKNFFFKSSLAPGFEPNLQKALIEFLIAYHIRIHSTLINILIDTVHACLLILYLFSFSLKRHYSIFLAVWSSPLLITCPNNVTLRLSIFSALRAILMCSPNYNENINDVKGNVPLFHHHALQNAETVSSA